MPPTTRTTAPHAASATDQPAAQRHTSLGVSAGRLYERIRSLKAEEEAEVKAAPMSIRQRFAKKRADVLGKAPPEVSGMVARWLKAEEPEGEDDAAE